MCSDRTLDETGSLDLTCRVSGSCGVEGPFCVEFVDLNSQFSRWNADLTFAKFESDAPYYTTRSQKERTHFHCDLVLTSFLGEKHNFSGSPSTILRFCTWSQGDFCWRAVSSCNIDLISSTSEVE